MIHTEQLLRIHTAQRMASVTPQLSPASKQMERQTLEEEEDESESESDIARLHRWTLKDGISRLIIM